MEDLQKQEYTTPRLVEYGRVEDLTHGPAGGSFDSLFGFNGGFSSGGGGNTHTSS